MARGRMLGRNAAFLYTDPATGQDVVIDLPAPLRDIRTRVVQRRYVEEALDGTRSIKTIGPAHYELIGRIRFIDAPDAMLAMLHAAANGAQLVYTDDVTDPHAKTYTAELIWDDAAIELGMDADLGKIGRGEVTVVLRSSTPWGSLYAGPDVLFRYRAGEPLSAAGAAFSRASSAWYISRDGILREAAPNVPRVEWYDLDGDGVRETPALRLEPAATNLLLWSEALDNATWTKTGLTVSPNATTAPDGQATADRLTEDTSTGQHLIRQSVSVAAGHQAFSIYLRDNGRRYASLYPQGAASGWAIFDLQSGSVAGTGGANFVRAYIDDAIQTASGVWYRCVVVVDVTAPGTLTPHVYLTNSATVAAPNYTGGGTLGVYAWGAQLEAAPVASSYVPTTASTVSRAADVLTFPWPHAPQAMTGYLRFVERGAITSPSENYLLRIGTLDPPPRLSVLHNGGIAPGYLVIYRLSTSQAVTASLPASPVPAIGDRVELLWRLYADGSVQIEQSINGGTPVVAARSAAIGLPTAWSGQVMRLSGVPSGGNEAPAAWRDAVVLRGAGWTMDQIRQRFSIS